MIVRANDGRKLDHKTLEEIRKRAVERVQAGESPEDVIRTLGFNRSCIYDWLARYRAGGWHALNAKPLTGRPKKITGAQIQYLYKAIVGKTPLQHRFEFALWTLRLVQWLIYEDLGVKLSRASVARLLKQMGLSCQRPLFRAMEQNADRVEKWKREEYPRIQKLAKQAGAEIWFEDESGVRSDYHGGTTWAPKGQTPVVRTTGARYRYNMISAVAPKGDLRFMLTTKVVTAPVFVEFLKRLLRGMKRPVFLILDGHPVHRSVKVQEYVASTKGRLQLFFLPAYSPELNPDEQVWAEVKAKGIGRRVITSARQMFSTLLGLLRSLQRSPKKIRAFFEHPETRYTIASA
jgi:transposase